MFEILMDPSNYPFWLLIIFVLSGAIVVISRPFSTYVKFVYPNAKFEAMGNPFIGEKELESIIDNKDLSSFKETINTLKDYNIKGENVFDVQKSLDETLIQTINMMKGDSSKKMQFFYDTYIEKFDLHLIKNTLKRKLEQKEIKSEIVGRALLSHTRTILNKIIDSNLNQLSTVLKDLGFSDEIVDVINSKEIDYLEIDSIIDKYFITKLEQVEVPYKCENGKEKFVKTLIDIINVKNILRGKQLGYDKESISKLFIGEGKEIASWKFNELCELDSVVQVISNLEGTSYYEILKDSIEKYNKDNSTQVLETALDCLFLKLVADISIQNYVTIGPTLRFLVSKEFEIRNLKIISKGINERLTPELIKDFLVVEVA